MKTTEIFVEQVLIGLLVLATGFLPYIDLEKINELLKSKSISEGAGIVAIAYLLGIVFDRFADTLLSRLEQFHRLTFTFKLIEKSKQYPGSDPYPEDLLKIKILKDGKEPSEYEHYLRIRIRLSRALAVFTPALTISALISSSKSIWPDINIQIYLSITGLIYLSCFVCIWNYKLLKIPRIIKTYEIDIRRSDFYFDEFVPIDEIENFCKAIWKRIKKYRPNPGEDTNKIKEPEGNLKEWLNEILQEPKLFERLSEKNNSTKIIKLVDKIKIDRSKKFSELSKDEQVKIKKLNRYFIENIFPQETPKSYSWCSWRSRISWREPTTIPAGVLFVMMIFLTVYYYEGRTCLVLLTGLGICTISALSWWKISETFMKFLVDCDKNNEGVKDAKTTDVKHENKDTLIGISKVNAKGVFYDD